MSAKLLYAVCSKEQIHRLLPPPSLADVEQGRDGMSHVDIVSAIYCSVGRTAQDIQELIDEMKLREDASPSAVNSTAFRVIVQMNALLDAIASSVQLNTPAPGVRGNVYFTDYKFKDLVLERCRQTVLGLPRYRGMTVRQLGNAAKHYGPWFGTASSRNVAAGKGKPERREWDLFDISGVGLMRDVIIPVYAQLRFMITHIADVMNDVVRIDLPCFNDFAEA